MNEQITMYCDGCSEPNPGNMGIGVKILKSNKVIKVISKRVGWGTNNIAEYTSLITGLEYCINNNIKLAEIKMDSQLVLNQVQDRWQVNKNKLKELYNKSKTLLKRLKSKIKMSLVTDNLANVPSRMALEIKTYGTLRFITKTRKSYTCRVCKNKIPAGLSCYTQNEYLTNETYPEKTRLCLLCKDKIYRTITEE